MNSEFNGLGLHLGNLSRLSNAETRSLSAENPTGAKGQGGRHVDPNHGCSRDLGTGWKVRPCVGMQPGETLVLADVDGPGAIQQIWMTPTGNYRFTILRCYWDGEETPSIEVPIGDFFASAYLPNQDDMASTAFWYQTEPHAAFPVLPDRDGLEII